MSITHVCANLNLIYYNVTSNESGSEAKRFMCSTSSCAAIVYDPAYDDILAIDIAAKNICHEDIRKNVSSSDAASNSTVTNSTTSNLFDIDLSQIDEWFLYY